MKLALGVFGVGFVVLGILLYFVHPLAPLFLLVSLLVQVPLVWGITRAGFSTGYAERAQKRREEYEQAHDAEAWLRGEESEVRGIGYKYWSRAARAASAVNRAEALCVLGRVDEAASVLRESEEFMQKLPASHGERLRQIKEKVNEE